MKRFFLFTSVLFSLLIFIFSCSNEEDNFSRHQNITSKEIRTKVVKKSLTEQEKIDLIKNRTLGNFTTDEKLQFLSNLYKAYDWEADSEYSENERAEMLRNADPYEFIRLMWLFEELETTKLKSTGEIFPTNSTKTTGKYAIRGSHSSYFVSSETEMVISYDTNSDNVSVTSTRIVKSNPSLTWDESSKGSTPFSNNKATVWAKGIAKSSGIKRNMKMEGYMTRYASSKLPSGGEVERFREDK